MHDHTTAGPEIAATSRGVPRLVELEVLDTLGLMPDLDARILDFGCGAGTSVDALRSRGYAGAVGYDVADGRTLADDQEHPGHIVLGSLLDLRLPFDDDTFDLVTSDQVFEHVQDQVRAFQELYRVTKPGGRQIHVIPARYAPVEGHIHVPFGGLLQHRWWYKLWAVLGIRNEHQHGLTADETADHNALFVTDATRYVSTSCYGVLFDHVGFEHTFAEQAFFDGHPRRQMRSIGRLGRPAMWLYRTFRSRVVVLHKPEAPPAAGPA